MKTETLVSSVKELANKLGVTTHKARKLVEKENDRLYERGTPAFVNNPCKMVHEGNRGAYMYCVEDIAKHI